MRRGDVVYRFGQFEVHPTAGRLLRSGQPVPLPPTAFAVLVSLIQHAPGIVDKNALARDGWQGTASVESVEQAISRVRKELGDADGRPLIHTVPNRGYRFVAALEELEADSALPADGLYSDAFHIVARARRNLASFTNTGIAAARRGFARAIAAEPGYAPAYIGMSTACALAFEGTRFAERCDLAALTKAIDSGERGVQLAPVSGDAWSALGFARCLAGESELAIAAAEKAVFFEPASWRHALRLGYVSWGEVRLAAARAALALRPRLAMAYWLKATVLIARGAFDAALEQLRDGCAAQDDQPAEDAAYPAVGLHLLRGLVLAAQGRDADAVAALETELAVANTGQIYWQECAANTWYALGGIRLRQRDFAGAEAAFLRALTVAPGHVFSMAALGRTLRDVTPRDPRCTDLRLAHVVARVRENRHADAARAVLDLLNTAPSANAGWLLTVEPVVAAWTRPEIWAPVLAAIDTRAAV